MKLFSFILFPNAKALKLKVKSRKIFKMPLFFFFFFFYVTLLFNRGQLLQTFTTVTRTSENCKNKNKTNKNKQNNKTTTK